MTYSDLKSDTHFLCGTDSTAYSNADLTRNMNRWYYKAATWVWKASKAWQFDDSNQTDLPIATTTLVDGQNDYTLPTGVLQIHAVEVKDNGGNSKRIQIVDRDQIKGTITDAETASGMPKYAYVFGNSIWLEPAPATASVTTTAGLKLYFARELDEFVVGDTTQEPGFAENFHRILSLGAAHDWLFVNDTSGKIDRIRSEIEALKLELYDFFGDKNKAVKLSVMPAHRTGDYI